MRFLSVFTAGFLAVASAHAADLSAELQESFDLYSQAAKEGAWEKAVVHAGAVETLAAKELPATDPSRLAASLNYGSALLRLKRQAQASDALENTVSLYERAFGKKDPRMLEPLVPYMAASVATKRVTDSEALGRRIISIAKSAYDQESLDYALIAEQVGNHLYHDINSTRGLRYLKQANNIFKSELGNKAPETGRTSFLIGKHAIVKKQYDTAEEELLIALDAFEQADHAQAVAAQKIVHGFLIHVYESTNESSKATQHCLAVGSLRGPQTNVEMLPVFRRAPRYPSEMLTKGKSGHVDFSYTVDAQGFVVDPVVDNATDRGFVTEARRAVKGFRYAPQFVDGKPVATENVRTRLKFELAR